MVVTSEPILLAISCFLLSGIYMGLQNIPKESTIIKIHSHYLRGEEREAQNGTSDCDSGAEIRVKSAF